jgi:hypothetical protein
MAASTVSARALIVLKPIFLVLSQIWDQAPAEAIQTALLGFWVEPNREDFLTRRDVNAYRISQAQKSAL